MAQQLLECTPVSCRKTGKPVTLGGFAGWYGESAWANAQVSYSWISYDVDREVQLGDVTRRHSRDAVR